MTEVFEVEKILASKKSRGKTLYKVRWKTFGPEEDTWEPVKHLSGCKELLQDFNAKEEQATKNLYQTQTKTEIKHVSNSVSLGRSLATPDVKIIRNGGGDGALSRRSLREGISTDVRSGVTTIVTPGATLRVTTGRKSMGTTSSRVTVSKTNASEVKDIPKPSADEDEDRMSPYVFLLFVLIILAVLFYIYQPL
ncbi:uncharacterized protein [Asterias amurensis]|uniref:uncharacterized protein n=1 Tax=Asterias amurensis TaxID=7602 RepID=UPI003AB3C4A8